MIGRASIANPGLTPVLSTATLCFFADSWIARAYLRLDLVGYASSSVVDTIGTRSLRISSTWPTICLERRARAQDDNVRGSPP